MIHKAHCQLFLIGNGENNYEKLLDTWADVFSPHAEIHMRSYFNKLIWWKWH